MRARRVMQAKLPRTLVSMCPGTIFPSRNTLNPIAVFRPGIGRICYSYPQRAWTDYLKSLVSKGFLTA
jgi:hypothetical protein